MNRLKTPRFSGAALTLILALGMASPASAHGLGAECKLQGDRVEVEAYYDDDTPARDAQITVQDAGRKKVAEGRTDAKGFWSFPRPASGRYRVTVDAGAGHRTTITVTVPPSPSGSAIAARSSSPECGCCKEGASAGAEQAAVKLDEGPGRDEFTRTPWGKIGLGFGAISSVGLAAWWALRLRRPGT